MTLAQQIDDKVREFLAGDYEVRRIDGVPTVENVPFGNVAVRSDLCALSIDIRNSTGLLEVHQRQTAGKVHKAFLYTAARLVNEYGGYNRSFKGDALLAFWPATSTKMVTQAVRCALAMKYMLGVKLQPRFAEYRDIDLASASIWGRSTWFVPGYQETRMTMTSSTLGPASISP